ncbi:cupin domain-containing protein [Candidatus Latescibacterota bacterium]
MLKKILMVCLMISGMAITFEAAQGALEEWRDNIPSTAPWSSTRPYSQLDPRNFSPENEPDIDMFISSWTDSHPVPGDGGLIERHILTPLEGEPLKPTRKGAVLTDIKRFCHVAIQAMTSTRPLTLENEQRIIYIDSGKGILTTGREKITLYEGIGLLIPPGIEFTLTNSGDEPLTMYIIAEPIPEEFKPNTEILVRDENALNLIPRPGHWAHNAKPLFAKEDGLALLVGISFVWIDPMTMSQPHSHEETVEEVWIALEGDITILLGKKLRKMSPGMAFKVPPNGTTPHSTINNTYKAFKLIWMMKLAD